MILKYFQKLFLLILTLTFFKQTSNAQIYIQSLLGHQGVDFNSFVQRNLTANKKLGYFGLANFYSDYYSGANNSYEISQMFNYKLFKGYGLSLGGGFSENEFVPSVGLYWGYEGDNLSIDLYPSVNYSLSEKGVSYSLFALMLYEPIINHKWSSYNQLIFDSGFDSMEHTLSYQQLWIGLNYKHSFQFGLGLNFEQYGSDFQFNQNIGVFISKEL